MIAEAFEPIFRLLNMLAFLAVSSLAAVAFLKLYLTQKSLEKDSGLHRSTSLDTASGVIFGATMSSSILYSPTDQEGHTLVCGGSGLGKTTALLIPTLQNWSGTFFAIDISGDISGNVTGKKSVVFDPFGISGKNTLPYNVFSVVDSLRGNIPAQNEQLEKLAFLLMPDTPGASDASIFFTNEGRKILTASLIAFYHAGSDFVEICRTILSLSWRDLFQAIDSQRNEVASMYISSFRGTNEQNTAGCKQSCDAAIKLFALNPGMEAALHRPHGFTTAIAPSLLEHTSIFFVIPDNMLDVYSPLLKIITAQCMAHFANRPIGSSPTILFALDEFASLGKLDIVGALQKFRKRNIRILALVQSLADLDLIYGQTERNSMLSNFKYKVVLGAGDPDTQEYFSRLIGQIKAARVSTTTGGSKTITEERTRAVQPEELGFLRDKLILIHPTGHMKLQKTYFFRPIPTLFDKFRNALSK